MVTTVRTGLVWWSSTLQKTTLSHPTVSAIKNVRKSAHSSLPAPTCFVDHRRI
uniref:Uncharacterized protein n=1 Tax=Chloracidobacterium thermophilum TaxID=458033 RepID=A8DJN2_9BACT|nr:hypothetical protein YS_M60-F11.125 [Chloracidobacterium thermophilum]